MRIIGVIFLILATCININAANDDFIFYMHQFAIRVKSETPSGNLGGAIMKNGKTIKSDKLPVAKPNFKDTASTFSGTGTISFQGNEIVVEFRSIKLKSLVVPINFDPLYQKPGFDPKHPKPGQNKSVFIAYEGIVSGTSDENITVSYKNYTLVLKQKSLRLTPDYAKAVVEARINSSLFTDNPQELVIKSDSCTIGPDGSFYGMNFHVQTTFKIRESDYQIKIENNDRIVVKVGKFFENVSNNEPAGIHFNVKATRDDAQYGCEGYLSSNANCSFSLNLLQPLERFPEHGYILHVKSGSVTYTYHSDQPVNCDGSFTVDMELPDSARSWNGNTVRLDNLILRTNKSGALYNAITLNEEFKMGPIFRLKEVQDTAWVYFPVWHNCDKNHKHSSYKKIDPLKTTVNISCNDLYDDLQIQNEYDSISSRHHLKRPGLTIIEGILFFAAPQIEFLSDPPGEKYDVKTRFAGALTLTPFGFTGDITSAGYSFIPSNQDISQSGVIKTKPRAAWKEILHSDSLKVKPSEPDSRFVLAGLEILDMRIHKMRVCMNNLATSNFRYVVHFPFPSYIDLEFEDKSLSSSGMFSNAAGPLSSISPVNVNTEDYGGHTYLDHGDHSADDKSPDSLYAPNPDTYILWAWHLPLSFSDRGVHITFQRISQMNTSVVQVTMDTNNKWLGKILSSEMWIPNLFSTNSVLRSGVRFKARFTKEGSFDLLDWDKAPFCARMYVDPGEERSVGFMCDLKKSNTTGIFLIDPATDPITRIYDYKWSGTIQFPFFGWQSISFQTKDQIPEMTFNHAMTATHQRASTCVDSIEQIGMVNPNINISVTSTALIYKYETNRFISNRVKASENVSGVLDVESLTMTSFTNALLILESTRKDIAISEKTTINCGKSKTTREKLINAISSRFIKDLVCYDHSAVMARGEEGTCCIQEYFLGTYQVSTQKEGEASEKIMIVAPDTKYFQYADPVRLEMNGSIMDLKSEEQENSTKININLGFAKLAYVDGKLQGDFSASYSDSASKTPFEGRFRFMLDPECGYFYFMASGSFTYFLKFTATLFILHCPFSDLTAPSPWRDVDTIITTLQKNSVSHNRELFLANSGFDVDGLTSNTVITGVLMAGKASYSKDFVIASVDFAAGAGLFLFQYQNENSSSINGGVFVNAEMGGCLLGIVKVGGYLNASYQTADNKIQGVLGLSACIDAQAAHCDGFVGGKATYTSSNGFDFEVGDNWWAHCAWGGCCPY